MRILFVYDLIKEHDIYWRDGLYEALNLLKKDYEIKTLNLAVGGEYQPECDLVLGWGSLNSKVVHFILSTFNHSKVNFGLCFGGGTVSLPTGKEFDVIFAESKVDLDYFKSQGYNSFQAFGTNTKFFKPDPLQPKIIDALYPASFALWKHQEIFSDICERNGWRGLAVGYFQPNNTRETESLTNYCRAKGVAVADWVPSSALVGLYNMSKRVVITADWDGGGQRTVLEAKACDVPVEVYSHSPKLLELKDLTRADVLSNWSEASYAERLKEGIESVRN